MAKRVPARAGRTVEAAGSPHAATIVAPKHATWPGRRTWVGLLVLLALTAGGGLWAAQGQRLLAAPSPSAPAVFTEPAVKALVARCRLAMASGVCRAMPAGATATAATPPSRLFIVGFGEVDGAVVSRLNQGGEAMCDTVGRTCQSQPGDELCRVAKALYPS